MKNLLCLPLRRVLLASTLILAPLLAYAGNPIPGVDVKLGRNPGGAIMAKTTTDKDGKFVFDNLAAGSYALSVAQPQMKTITTSYSNKKHPPAKLENGVQVVTANVEMGAGPFSTDIEITAAHGKITGVVTRADAAKPGGAQPVQDAKPAR